jgi:parallel beta-helix repeat protein
MILPKTIVFCALMLTIPSFGWPADFYVTTGDVSGLNDAINTANTNDEADTIHLEAGLYSILEYNPQDSQTYFHITSPISILGAGRVRTIIERNADFRFNFFLIDSLGELRLRDVTLSGGDGSSSCGGAIRIEGGKLAVEFSTISNNYSRFAGGGICNLGGTLTVDHGIFTGNTAKNEGGAISNNYDAIATITNSTFRNNQAGRGGALYNDLSELFIIDSIISANSATGAGGGVSSSARGVSSSTTIDITSTTISGNTAGFDGGGLYLHSSNTTIRKSTISNNFASHDGGGVWAGFGNKFIANTTISGNRANGYGGGIVKIDSSGSARLNNVTVAFNVADYDGDGIGLGGGIANGPSSRTTFSNTIIAGNLVNLDASECNGTLSSEGHNLLQVVTPDCDFNPFLSIIGEDPLLGLLTNNGGLTDTHALAPGSPAINAGNPGSCEETDQRGVPRNCDIGAYELGILPPDPSFQTNSGLNDAWYNPETSGQGFFITVFPDLNAVSLAWFTYDTELPPDGATANLGDPGHRWITAIGTIDGNQVAMDIDITSGGIFDTVSEITHTDPPGSDGAIMLEFSSCNRGTVTYDIPSINRQGTVPIQRVAHDNIALCEALNAD